MFFFIQLFKDIGWQILYNLGMVGCYKYREYMRKLNCFFMFWIRSDIDNFCYSLLVRSSNIDIFFIFFNFKVWEIQFFMCLEVRIIDIGEYW